MAPVDLEQGDQWPPGAEDISFPVEPERSQDDRLRRQVTMEPGSSLVISDEFRTE
jgi:hypothetical protein